MSDYSIIQNGQTKTIPGTHLSSPVAALMLARTLSTLYGVACAIVQAETGTMVYPPGATEDYLAVSIPDVADGKQRLPINCAELLAMAVGQGSWQQDSNGLPTWVQLPPPPPPTPVLTPGNSTEPFPGFNEGSGPAPDPNGVMKAQVQAIYNRIILGQ